MDSAVWGIVGTAVGALASIGTTWLSNRHAQKLQTLTSLRERQERFNAFQRETLIDLQEALHDALRLATQAHLEDEAAFHAGGTWNENVLSEDVNEGVRIAQRRVAILAERVADEKLRTEVVGLMAKVNAITMSNSLQDSRSAWQESLTRLTLTSVSLGTTLRALY